MRGNLEKNKSTEIYLIQFAREHKEHFTTAKKWDEFASSYGYPTSRQYIYQFGSWNQAKQLANLPLSNRKEYTYRKYNKEDLIQIIKEYQEHFISKEEWNKYAKANGLPHYETFLYHDISWKEILEITGKKKYTYTRQELLTIAEENGEYFANRNTWDDYAKPKELPNSYEYIKEFGNWINVKHKILKIRDEDLIEIAKKYELGNFSRRKWDEYAKEHNLPPASMYIDRFGSWNRLKAMLY
ncbi:hypothetical protein [Schinkia azotoformans]|uniref:hypothetical protein n=1 Tax=Schinkia azotoformans TaxID=1454 RepID=UPI002DBA9826|nr:hypothetical protein [Schinkia azotoformans]MEC1716490.1 hypothetical protein [Schinkia azotoformans]MEC1756242.1 hypothetical protein [Schinkia azotoformans]